MENKGIKQKKFLKCTKVVEWIDDGNFLVQEVFGNKKREYNVCLNDLCLHSRRHKKKSYVWGGVGIFCTALSIATIVSFFSENETMVVPLFMCLGMFGTMAVISSYKYITCCYNYVIYDSIHDSEGIVLYADKPTKKEFVEFTDFLNSKLKKSQRDFDQYKLEKEIASIDMISSLLKNGYLSFEEFNSLRDNIVSGKSEETSY